MTDKNFNGQVKEITLYILSDLLSPLVHRTTNKIYKSIVELHSLTYNYYRYLKSQGSYIDNKENPFSEPAVIYSNVINGYGIFTSFNLARDTIR